MRPRCKSRNGRFFGGRAPVFGYNREFFIRRQGLLAEVFRLPCGEGNSCFKEQTIRFAERNSNFAGRGTVALQGKNRNPDKVQRGAPENRRAPLFFKGSRRPEARKEKSIIGRAVHIFFRGGACFFSEEGRAGAVVRRGEGEITSGAPRMFSGETCGRGCLRGREKGMPFVRAAVAGSGEQTINFPIAACGRISSCRLRKKAVVCLKSFPLIYR